VPPWLQDPVRDLRARARRRLGIERLHERIDELQAQLRALEPGGWDRSRERWRGVQPDAGLTWGQELSGDAFIAKISEYGAFHPGTRILEIGPGYGRLLKACLDLGVPFSEYVGLDISATNIEHLRERFADPRTSFFVGDAESADLEHRYDLLVSSLVFKHLYPTFEATLSNCARMLEPGALACFDLIEGDHSMFEADRVTYIKCYTRPQVEAILHRAGFALVAFARVRHDPDHERLLTVARRSARPPVQDTALLDNGRVAPGHAVESGEERGPQT